MDWKIGGLLVSILYGLGHIYARKCLTKDLDSNVLIFYFFLIYGIISIIIFLFLTHKKIDLSIDTKELINITIIVVLFATGTMFLFYSIKNTKILGILQSMRAVIQIIFVAILGYLYLGESLTIKDMIGILFCCIGIYLIL
tara:strand:+ start:323 stop:745 length:423 start_codon:yes stop_codon:yes gene_type:complete